MYGYLGSIALVVAAVVIPFFKKVPAKTRPAGILLGLAGIELTASFDVGGSLLSSLLLAPGFYLARQAWVEWQQQIVIDRGNAAVERMSKATQG